MATKPKPKPAKTTVSVAVASCTIYATFAMECPLCRVIVPAETEHTCGRKG